MRADVAAVLFDEPLTVIDPHLKWLLRRKLKQIHQQLKLSLIYVTHDQIEALTFADQVVVMTRGRVVQIGTPEQLFERPAHRFVGHFIGSPGMNFLPARGSGGRRDDRRRCAMHDEQHAAAAGRRGTDASACGRSTSSSRRRPGANRRAGARRRDARPGHPHDGATAKSARRSLWAKLRDPARCPARRHGVRCTCRRHAARSTRTNGECA